MAAAGAGHANREMLKTLMKAIGSLKLPVLAALLLAPMLAHTQTDTITGTWRGYTQTPPNTTQPASQGWVKDELVLHIEKTAGSYHLLVSDSEGYAHDTECKQVSFSAGQLKFDLPLAGGSVLPVSLTIEKDRMTGTWSNPDGYSSDIRLQREPAVPRKSTAPSHAPEFELLAFDGRRIRSGDLKGKVVLLDFWSVTCRPCLVAMPKLAQLYQQFENDPQVVILLVNNGWDPLAVARSYAEDRKDHLPFAYDENSKVFESFRLKSNPSTILIDRQYRVALQHSGDSPQLLEELPQRIRELLH